jgi:radical S-adenosyl methionine domain-containing protein 2
LTQPLYTQAFRSADWHLTTECNYNCKFCFAKHLDKEICDLNLVRKRLRQLKILGIEKINFAGGEPLLHPLFFDVIKTAKDMGLVVSVLSNGYFLNKKIVYELSSYVDWIGFSVDSANEDVEASLGRGKGNHVKHIVELSDIVHKAGVKLKINTTVTKLNWAEDMRPLLKILRPNRWKVFQVIHIEGQNDRYFDELSVTDFEFSYFKSINQECCLETQPVFERNEDMIGSYLMISPGGKVFSNLDGTNYSLKPLKDVKKRNIAQLLDVQKYVKRGAIYSW